MAADEPLFSLSLAPTGSLVCSKPSTTAAVYLLTLTSPPDNRLTTQVCQALLLALDIIEHSGPPGVVISTSGIAKFYSNGLDLNHATSTPGFWEESLYPLFRRFLTYPMPTLALINGHAFAGGLMLAMYHDYRVFNPTRGFLCLNELDFGATLMSPMSAIFRQKLPSPTTYRSLVLEAKRFGAEEALREGIVDRLGGSLSDALTLVRERGLDQKARSGVYGALKAEMWRETVALLDDHEGNQRRTESVVEADQVRTEAAERRVREWQRGHQTKAKL